MIKTLLGYDIVEGVSAEEYERWLFEVHAPDLLSNPHLDRIVFNTILRPVTSASGGTAKVPPSLTFYRIAELHFADEEAYSSYLEWFSEHPLAAERGPGGRTDFRFYLVADSVTVDRSNMTRLSTML
jgi:hypothetical protein